MHKLSVPSNMWSICTGSVFPITAICSHYCADSQNIPQIHGSTRATVISAGKEKHGDYLKVLILSDQLLPGKNLISLDAFKAVLSLFILKNKALQLTSALSLNAPLTTQQAINDQGKVRDNGLFREHRFQYLTEVTTLPKRSTQTTKYIRN